MKKKAVKITFGVIVGILLIAMIVGPIVFAFV